MPGRGKALTTPAEVEAGLAETQDFISQMFTAVKQGVNAGMSLKQCYQSTYSILAPKFGKWVIFDHCMPFDVSRAYDEASGIEDPRIWTAERDKEMWLALEQE